MLDLVDSAVDSVGQRIGTTSITVAIEAWVRRGRLDDRVKVTQAHYVYVALDEQGRKRPIAG